MPKVYESITKLDTPHCRIRVWRSEENSGPYDNFDLRAIAGEITPWMSNEDIFQWIMTLPRITKIDIEWYHEPDRSGCFWPEWLKQFEIFNREIDLGKK